MKSECHSFLMWIEAFNFMAEHAFAIFFPLFSQLHGLTALHFPP